MTTGADRPPSALVLWSAGLGIVASLVGVQGLAASTPVSSDVLMLLPPEGILAGVGDGLRRGYGLAMQEARSCGVRPPTLGLGWLPPGQDPRAALAATSLPELLIAPPAVPLRPFGELAQDQGLSVLLPLQRGHSVERLPGQVGGDRLWPVVPPRSQDVDRLARGLLQERQAKVMVIHDGTSEQAALADRFIDTIDGDGGWVVGPTEEPEAILRPDEETLAKLRENVDWYTPQSLVVMTTAASPLAKAVASGNWPPELLLAWPFAVGNPLANPQLGVDPLSRGPAWSGFEQAFRRSFGYAPGLVEAAGYDTGQLVALASQTGKPQRFWDLTWLDPKARPQNLCQALKDRRSGRKVALRGAASRLDLAPGTPPTAELRLTPLKADATATPP